MDKFEEKLMNMKVEKPEITNFRHELKRDLINKFVHEKNYQTQFRLAFGFSCIMLFFTILTIFDPRVAVKLNEITFNSYQNQVEELDFSNPAPFQNLQYTTINNPKLMEQIDAEGYEEEKAYIIRQYRGENKKPVMVVSEFKKDSTPMIKQASVNGI